MRRLGGLGVLLAVAGLAGCSKPPKVVAIAPPPVGHIYPVMVSVPAGKKPMPAADQQKVQQAFNVIALKSSLMVGALACEQQSSYDTFMTSFQPHILEEQHVMDAYFKKIGGYRGQSTEDDFVTLMANNQSVSGIAQGQVFCLNNKAEFDKVLAMKDPVTLDTFVTDQAPAIIDAAPVPGNPVVTRPATKSLTTKKTHSVVATTPVKKKKAVTVADNAAP